MLLGATGLLSGSYERAAHDYSAGSSAWGELMENYEIDAPVEEILRWIAEDATHKTPRLLARASKEYRLETDFDREEFGIGEDEDVEAVSVRGVLELQSLAGLQDWTLRLKAEDVVGLRTGADENLYQDEYNMDIAAFTEQFLSKGDRGVEVVVAAETPKAKVHFDRWLTRRMKARGA